MNDRVERLRQEGLAKIRANQIEDAVALFDQALAIAQDDDQREILTINKAGALIAMEKNGPEVAELPRIIMRRRNLRHVYVAAYNLQHKYTLERDFKKADFYGRVALQVAEESGEPRWKCDVQIALGNTCVYDSRIPEAIAYYQDVLAYLDATPDNSLSRSFTMQNLGYSRLLNDQLQEGVDLILEAIELMKAAGAEGYAAESYIDLCFGYLELGELDLARHYGQMGLERATEVRQVRNGHYLLGEVAYKSGDIATAESHFEHLAKFYPDFAHLKDLLLAIDLRGMVNLKL